MIDGKLLVEKLLTYAEEFLHLEKLDVIYTRNLLLREFKLDAPIEDAGDLSYIREYKVPDLLVQEIEAYALENSLAEEWSKVGNTSYVIKLKSGIKWSNGSDFSAYDVLYTIDRLKEVSSIYSYNVQYVIGAEVIDNNTIKIELDREVPFFEYNLIFPILSKSYYEGEDFVAETDLNGLISRLISFYICYQLKMCESISYAAENVLRSQITSSALEKLDEKEKEQRHEEMKKRKEKSVLKSVENFKKLG
jgi:hypothetical protein